ncbi:hypothetical protein H3Z85_08980 [Chryseobacterium indologenes]|uniref:hypothetical protein n=1 Tax=Chryseobacterium indologenes TaxID=253 RepID=UPI0003E0862A|nr:hypothetical protein [Chryseobacterium indologenes]ASE63537.1 hypothetical protein CEQ15_19640 [Chryseobacterium indologenes]AYZ37552.1 hypothetical protein EGY07_19395 [Chryseobacterium indologenes]MBF6646424.1 hypothetical protein [Chryseobacterium indologenes]MBU3046847.1 hypothetical protein [Chryseobacterium indologenes]MEB4761921.1 hypothetical protein [Chryseobacterium indologenes]
MNKTLLILFSLITCFWIKAQTFTDKTLSQAVLQLNNAKTTTEFDTLFNKFSNVKTTEKWQANYYAAVTLYLKNEMQLKKTSGQNLDESNSLARKLAISASTSQRENPEITTLIGLIYFQKMQLSKSQDVQKDGDVIAKIIAKVEKTSPDNPRVNILKAKLKEKSGDKTEADLLAKKALQTLESQNPSEAASPTWGKSLLQ